MSDQVSSQNSSAGLEGFAARLTNVIAHTGLSQAEFARRLGVSAGFMSDAARGLKRPGAEFLHSVRTVFGVSIDWLLTGDGTMHGGSGIDLNLLRTIRLQIAVARAAIIDADPVAKVLLLLIRDGRLNEAVADPDLQAFLNRIAPADPDGDLAAELYNGHLWTKDSSEQLRNLLAAAVAHFEARKPLDKMAALVRSAGPTIQINVSPSQRNAGRDYYEG
ncbi:MAG: helix-turn-helix transcriptional regulator [Zoogloea sp.]|jgi:transcriptional regulator with XRE-family HTH domain|uniref:helix-turn-helix domain-containing protein n=1 Tax=Zoogloea sp. TaxID=49181 RepID=UPI00262BFFDB|nr:helix-turn-helix transcriptional regulator [Zoogloea sp.]MDD2991146.1 helix-turn-helix transcriptional regulator [Zoogloea sp.]